MKNNDEIIADLVTKGAIEIEGIDPETGEFLFKITDKMKDVNEELYKIHQQELYDDIMYFWEKGFVEIEDFFSPNPVIGLSKKCIDASEISSLPKDKQRHLKSIIDAVLKN